MNKIMDGRKTKEHRKYLRNRNYEYAKIGKCKFFTSEYNPMKSEVSKRKMGETQRRKWIEGKYKLNTGNFKREDVRIGRGKNHSMYGKIPHNKGKTKYNYEPLKVVSKKISLFRKNWITPKFDTSIEIKIQNFLKELEIPFVTHDYLGTDPPYRCDIFIPLLNLVIECDGDYWHKYPTGKEIDTVRTIQMYLKGYKIVRLWEHEIKEMNLEEFRKIIYGNDEEFLEKRNQKLKELFIRN